MLFKKKTRLHPNSRIPYGIMAAVGGALAFWALRSWIKRRMEAGAMTDGGRTGFPEGNGQEEWHSTGHALEADRLGKHWHSLDKEGKPTHIPKALEREPKNPDQKIHMDPITEEASFLD